MRLINSMLLCCILLCSVERALALPVERAVVESVAVQGYTGDVSDQAPLQCGGVSLSQAVEQVRRQYNGQIVSAETRPSGNCETHIIKVLTKDGKVKTVRVAGRSRS